MAKLIFASFAAGLSGKSGANVYYSARSNRFGYLRGYVYPSLTPNNSLRGQDAKNIKSLFVQIHSTARLQLDEYVALYKDLTPVGGGFKKNANSPYMVFSKAMWAWHNSDPTHVTFNGLGFDDYQSMIEEPMSISSLIRNNFLPAVEGWEDMSKSFETGTA